MKLFFKAINSTFTKNKEPSPNNFQMSSPLRTQDATGEVSPVTLGYKWLVPLLPISTQIVGEKLISPLFSTRCTEELNWRIWLYPKGEDETAKDCMSIYIEYKSELDVTASIVFSILNANHEKIIEKISKVNKFTKDLNDTWGFPKFVEQSFIADERHRVLLDNQLTILCEIITDASIASTILPWHGTSQSSDSCNQLPKVTECTRKVTEFEDLEKLLENGKYSDLTITTDEKAFHVHKAILSARSPVFDNIIDTKAKEQDQTGIEIKNMKWTVLKELLRYIYSGKVNDLENMANDLLSAADKYDIQGLKFECEKCLYKNLTVHNALEYLKLADASNAPKLKSQAIKFIVPHLEDIVDKPEFKILGDLQSDSICDFVRAIIVKNKK